MIFILVLIFVCTQITNISTVDQKSLSGKVNFLEDKIVKTYIPERKRLGFFESEIQIYCYNGSNKDLWRYFQTNYFLLDIDSDDYTQFEGSTPEIVKAHHDENKSIFQFNFLTFKKTNIKLNPFNQSCIGIETLQPYKIRLVTIRTDLWKIGYFIIGFSIFLFAKYLSNNPIFYYLSGITLGICTSFIILVFLAGKLFPRRPMMYGVLIGGWTLAFYFIRMLWDNVQLILISYYNYVLWYIFITGFLSFVVCYRMGPPTNKRSKNLIKWGLKMIGLIFLYFSSEMREASIGVILLITFLNYIPLRFGSIRLNRIYRRYFPPKRRLLTMQEYDEQGIVETKKALHELRMYCNSPECKQWKIMTSLKNPKRFASFVEGEQHLMDEEIYDHESSKFNDDDSDFSDDENEKENDGNEISEDDDDDIQPHKNIYRSGSSSSRRNGESSNYYNKRLSTSYISPYQQNRRFTPPVTHHNRLSRSAQKDVHRYYSYDDDED